MKKYFPILILILSALTASAGLQKSATIMPYEWEEFRFSALGVIQNNPELSAADKNLKIAMQAQKAKVEAAMIKIDPKVAQILKKLKPLLKNGWKMAGASGITLTEWQELRTARAAALKANPDLLATNKQLLKQRDALDAKVDAAMIKANLGTAAFINSDSKD